MDKHWFNIRNAAPGELVVEIFNEIGFWGTTAKQFAAQLKAAGAVSKITLKLDCPGGDCNEGFTIYDALKNTGAQITTEIVGVAASMASVIMLAGDTIRIAENGRVMIHRVTAGAMGNADELDAAAKVAKQFEDRIVSLYVARTGQSEQQVREWMKADMGTWFFGQDAVDAGFADEIIQGAKAKAFNNRWASMFTMLPSALFDTSAAIDPPHIGTSDEIHMKAALIALAKALRISLPANATEEDITKAFEGYKPEQPTAALDLEDKETAERFRNAVDAQVKDLLPDQLKPLKDEVSALKGENERLTALIKNGQVAGAQGGSPVNGKGEQAKKEMAFSAFNKLPHAERQKFTREGGKIIDG